MDRELNEACGTCNWREDGKCVERRSAYHDWRVGEGRWGCYFYSRRRVRLRLPLIGGGLEEPGEGESDG